MLHKYKLDKSLIFFIFLFFIISLISIYSASIYLSKTLGNLVLKQTIWYLVGIIFIFIIIKIGNEKIYKYAWYIYLCNILLLLGLLVVAPSINGSKCWYIINGIGSFQPSEFMKISLIIMNAKIIDSFKNKYSSPRSIDELKLIFYIFLLMV